MISNLKDALVRRLSGKTWMDRESLSRAVTKADSIAPKIGYPDVVSNNLT
jgi:predicted metalloendopeptidase